MRTLEILIPTFGRPASAADAMESVIACKDTRLGARCNSNGHEPTLERFRNLDPRLVYDCFETNRGFHYNCLHIIRSANAKFLMLLSDEDRINTKNLPDFLDFLDVLNERISVVSCSIFDLVQNRFYHLPNKRLLNISCDGNAFIAFNLVPSYMSGIVYVVSKIRQIDFEKQFLSLPGNAYPQLDLAMLLLINGRLDFYVPRLVLKGEEITIGGDGYSHKTANSKKHINNLNLNPEVYGPYARTRQFFYRERILNSLQEKFNKFAYVLGKLNLCWNFLQAVQYSPNVVIFTPGMNLKEEVRRAITDVKREGYYSGSITSKLFCWYSILPKPTFKLYIRVMDYLLRILKRIYMIKY